jgi:hypothetical protein
LFRKPGITLKYESDHSPMRKWSVPDEG